MSKGSQRGGDKKGVLESPEPKKKTKKKKAGVNGIKTDQRGGTSLVLGAQT